MTNPTTPPPAPVYLEEPFTYTPTLGPGVWPQKGDIRGHFQVIGTNARGLVVADMGGLIDFGGVHVTSPEDLDEMASRLRGLADRMRNRAAPRHARETLPCGALPDADERALQRGLGPLAVEPSRTPQVEHNGTADHPCTECGHRSTGQVPGCGCYGCHDETARRFA